MGGEKHEDAIGKFWDRYLSAVHARGISEPFDRWYFIRARDYVHVDHGAPLRQQTAEHVTEYLQELGRKTELKDWQCQQVVGAIQILFQDIVRVGWASSFDWDGWKAQFRENALIFLYKHVLKQDLGGFGDFARAKRPRRLPGVLSRDETKRLLAEIDGIFALMAGLLYGSGMRLMECIRLRVCDVDFE